MEARRDVIVIGRGLSACAAALEARRLEMDVVVVEPPSCASELSQPLGLDFHALREVARRLLQCGAERDGAQGLGERAVAAGAALLAGERRRAEACGVAFAAGDARIVAADAVEVGAGARLHAGILIIATGTRARRSPRVPLSRVVCDTDGVLAGPVAPRSALILGGEVLGCELACLFATQGTSVTLVDRRARLLRFADREVLEVLHMRMRELGIAVVLEEEVESLEVQEESREPHAVVRLASGRVEKCDRVVLLGGRQPNLEGLGLEALGVACDAGGFVSTDEYFQSSQPGIYAVGDVIGSAGQVASVAYQARTALLHGRGEQRIPDEHLPMGIHTIPEVAMVGFTEEACRLLGLSCLAGVARYGDTLAGQLVGAREDLLKLVFARDDRRLLGVHWIGHGAIELVHLGALWLRQGATADDLANAPFSPLSLAELYRTAALDAVRELDGVATSSASRNKFDSEAR
jgi:NAD(P) transhydrogenase